VAAGTVAGNTGNLHQDALLDEVGRRWRAADPLLPAPAALAPADDCGAILTLPGADGRPVAAGRCKHWHGKPDDLELTWGATHRFELTILAGGPDLPAAVDRLLSVWRMHLAGLPGIDEPDSAAVIMWPSRDADGVRALRRHGLSPHVVVAARAARATPGRAERGEATRPVPAPDSTVRRAGATDLDVVTRLGLETIRYDALFGSVIERPSTATALRRDVVRLLADPQPWIWLAERDGTATGVLIAEPPDATGWIATLVSLAPVAYNDLTFVSPAERGSGVADALVTSFHVAAAAADVQVTLLHYEQTNPLSVPFWSRYGYRPLWTSWEIRPAGAMR
jgi:GNAT superfamily N-acetyltransferase